MAKYGVLVLKDNPEDRYILKPGVCNIGSSILCNLRIYNKNVPDVQCVVDVDNIGLATIVSKNIFPQTKLNDIPLLKNKKTILNNGDFINIGGVEFVYNNEELTQIDQQELAKKKKLLKPKLFPFHTPNRRGSLHLGTKSAKKVALPSLFPNLMKKRRSSLISFSESSKNNVSPSLDWPSVVLNTQTFPSKGNFSPASKNAEEVKPSENVPEEIVRNKEDEKESTEISNLNILPVEEKLLQELTSFIEEEQTTKKNPSLGCASSSKNAFPLSNLSTSRKSNIFEESQPLMENVITPDSNSSVVQSESILSSSMDFQKQSPESNHVHFVGTTDEFFEDDSLALTTDTSSFIYQSAHESIPNVSGIAYLMKTPDNTKVTFENSISSESSNSVNRDTTFESAVSANENTVVQENQDDEDCDREMPHLILSPESSINDSNNYSLITISSEDTSAMGSLLNVSETSDVIINDSDMFESTVLHQARNSFNVAVRKPVCYTNKVRSSICTSQLSKTPLLKSQTKSLQKRLRIQKTPNNGLTNVVGVKRLLQTPMEQASPNLQGVKELMQTPAMTKSIENVAGTSAVLLQDNDECEENLDIEIGINTASMLAQETELASITSVNSNKPVSLAISDVNTFEEAENKLVNNSKRASLITEEIKTPEKYVKQSQQTPTLRKSVRKIIATPKASANKINVNKCEELIQEEELQEQEVESNILSADAQLVPFDPEEIKTPEKCVKQLLQTPTLRKSARKISATPKASASKVNANKCEELIQEEELQKEEIKSNILSADAQLVSFDPEEIKTPEKCVKQLLQTPTLRKSARKISATPKASANKISVNKCEELIQYEELQVQEKESIILSADAQFVSVDAEEIKDNFNQNEELVQDELEETNILPTNVQIASFGPKEILTPEKYVQQTPTLRKSARKINATPKASASKVNANKCEELIQDEELQVQEMESNILPAHTQFVSVDAEEIKDNFNQNEELVQDELEETNISPADVQIASFGPREIVTPEKYVQQTPTLRKSARKINATPKASASKVDANKCGELIQDEELQVQEMESNILSAHTQFVSVDAEEIKDNFNQNEELVQDELEETNISPADVQIASFGPREIVTPEKYVQQTPTLRKSARKINATPKASASKVNANKREELIQDEELQLQEKESNILSADAQLVFVDAEEIKVNFSKNEELVQDELEETNISPADVQIASFGPREIVTPEKYRQQTPTLRKSARKINATPKASASKVNANKREELIQDEELQLQEKESNILSADAQLVFVDAEEIKVNFSKNEELVQDELEETNISPADVQIASFGPREIVTPEKYRQQTPTLRKSARKINATPKASASKVDANKCEELIQDQELQVQEKECNILSADAQLVYVDAEEIKVNLNINEELVQDELEETNILPADVQMASFGPKEILTPEKCVQQTPTLRKSARKISATPKASASKVNANKCEESMQKELQLQKSNISSADAQLVFVDAEEIKVNFSKNEELVQEELEETNLLPADVQIASFGPEEILTPDKYVQQSLQTPTLRKSARKIRETPKASANKVNINKNEQEIQEEELQEDNILSKDSQEVTFSAEKVKTPGEYVKQLLQTPTLRKSARKMSATPKATENKVNIDKNEQEIQEEELQEDNVLSTESQEVAFSATKVKTPEEYVKQLLQTPTLRKSARKMSATPKASENKVNIDKNEQEIQEEELQEDNILSNDSQEVTFSAGKVNTPEEYVKQLLQTPTLRKSARKMSATPKASENKVNIDKNEQEIQEEELQEDNILSNDSQEVTFSAGKVNTPEKYVKQLLQTPTLRKSARKMSATPKTSENKGNVNKRLELVQKQEVQENNSSADLQLVAFDDAEIEELSNTSTLCESETTTLSTTSWTVIPKIRIIPSTPERSRQSQNFNESSSSLSEFKTPQARKSFNTSKNATSEKKLHAAPLDSKLTTKDSDDEEVCSDNFVENEIVEKNDIFEDSDSEIFESSLTSRKSTSNISTNQNVDSSDQSDEDYDTFNDLKNDVAVVEEFLPTTKVQRSPNNDLTDVRGVKRVLATPKVQREPENDLTKVRGLKKLMATPKVQKSPLNDLTDIRGVKKILATPKAQREPENDLTKVKGLKKLMATPKVQKSPLNDLTDIQGVKKILATPKVQNEPKNDLTEVRGLKKLMATPKVVNSPNNDLTDVGGVKKMFADHEASYHRQFNVSGVAELMNESNNLFDALVGKKPIRTYSRKNSTLNKSADSIASHVTDAPVISPEVVNWVNTQEFHNSSVISDINVESEFKNTSTPIKSIKKKEIIKCSTPISESIKSQRGILKELNAASSQDVLIATPEMNEDRLRKVQFLVEEGSLRRSKRTPKTPIKITDGFVLSLPKQSNQISPAKTKYLVEKPEEKENNKRSAKSKKGVEQGKESLEVQVVAKKTTRKRGLVIDNEDESNKRAKVTHDENEKVNETDEEKKSTRGRRNEARKNDEIRTNKSVPKRTLRRKNNKMDESLGKEKDLKESVPVPNKRTVRNKLEEEEKALDENASVANKRTGRNKNKKVDESSQEEKELKESVPVSNKRTVRNKNKKVDESSGEEEELKESVPVSNKRTTRNKNKKVNKNLEEEKEVDENASVANKRSVRNKKVDDESLEEEKVLKESFPVTNKRPVRNQTKKADGTLGEEEKELVENASVANKRTVRNKNKKVDESSGEEKELKESVPVSNKRTVRNKNKKVDENLEEDEKELDENVANKRTVRNKNKKVDESSGEEKELKESVPVSNKRTTRNKNKKVDENLEEDEKELDENASVANKRSVRNKNKKVVDESLEEEKVLKESFPVTNKRPVRNQTKKADGTLGKEEKELVENASVANKRTVRNKNKRGVEEVIIVTDEETPVVTTRSKRTVTKIENQEISIERENGRNTRKRVIKASETSESKRVKNNKTAVEVNESVEKVKSNTKNIQKSSIIKQPTEVSTPVRRSARTKK